LLGGCAVAEQASGVLEFGGSSPATEGKGDGGSRLLRGERAPKAAERRELGAGGEQGSGLGRGMGALGRAQPREVGCVHG
jgi:hypothetical protein